MKPTALLKEAVWPRRAICLCCGRPARGGHLCSACEQALREQRIKGPVCKVCGHRLKQGCCDFCHGSGTLIMRAAWVYGGEVRRLVHTLKFESVAIAAQVMAEGMTDAARALRLPPETVITWPTMPASRELERGIDHGALLASIVGERLGLPVKRLLTRSDSVAAHTQVGLSDAERRTRLKGAFTCEERLNGPVLLVDDVLTTSATATACAECLMAAGATRVTVVTAAQTPSHQEKNLKGSA